MNLEGLKLFKEIAMRGSISKVAESSHFSQPAISQQVKRLEDQLGYELLLRSNRGVELTEAGKIVLKYAKSIIKAQENMMEDLSYIDQNFSVIRLNCTPIISTYALPCTVYSINNKSNKLLPAPLKIELYTNHSDEVETNIANETFDLGIVISAPSSSLLASDKIASDTVIPVAAIDYHLNGTIKVSELAESELILPSSKFRIRARIIDWFKQQGYRLADLNILSSMDEIESIKSTVVKGFGISFLPYLSIKKELYTKQLKKLEIENFNIDYDICLIYKENRMNDLNFRDFVKMFRKTARKTFC